MPGATKLRDAKLMSAASAVTPFQLHATTIAVRLAGTPHWVAVAIRGDSGSGKSDLALRCLAQPLHPLWSASTSDGVRLVADDQTVLTATGDNAPFRLMASAPDAISGLLEVRGLGIVAVPAVATAQLVLIADLVAAAEVPRHPEPSTIKIADTTRQIVTELPQLLIDPFTASSPIKLMLALIRTALIGVPVGADATKPQYLPEGQ